MARDPYEVLGVARGAADSDVKKAWRRVARDLHPDANPGDPHAEEHFKEAAEAYEILSDPEKRRRYDAYGHEGLRGRGGGGGAEAFGFGDIFDAFFGGGQGARRRPGQAPSAVAGEDVAVAVGIELGDAARGTTVEVEYDAVTRCEHCRGGGAEPGSPIDPCPQCRGTGQLQSVARTPFGQVVRTAPCDRCFASGRVPRTPCATCDGAGRVREGRRVEVEIPPGIADGQRIRLTGRGHAGQLGGDPGDLYVVVRVREDERFLRDGEHLVTVLDVPAPLAALGARLDVETLDGPVPVEVPAGTQPGDTIVLEGRGLPPLRRGVVGDLRVVVNVVVPRSLDKEQKKLYEQIAASLHDGNTRHAEHEGLLSKLRRTLRT